MWKNDRERPDDPQTRERETQRLARDEYERPLYGSPQSGSPQPPSDASHHGSPPRQNQGPTYDRAAWRYRSQPAISTPARTLDDIRAHELMTRRVATVHPASSVERAARLMAECDCGGLPVVGDNGVLVGMVTDYDCWRSDVAHVEVADVIRQLGANAALARRLVEELARLLPPERTASPIDTVLDQALITDPAHRDPALLAKLDAVAGRVLNR